MKRLHERDLVFERRLATAGILIALAVFALCFWPLLDGRLFLYGDLGNWHLPTRLFYAESLRAGTSPLWLPHLFCGFPLHAEGQVGMAHPLHALLYRLLPTGAAFGLECSLAYPLAFAGMTLFLLRFRVPRAAAVCGGAAFGFSSYLLVRYTHVNAVGVLAHVPWLLLLLDIAHRTRRAEVRLRCWIGIALLTGSQLLLGHPSAVATSLAYLGLYALLLAAEARSPRILLELAAASGVGFLIGAVQWIPTLELLARSQRAAPSFAALATQSLHPWNLLQPLAPYVFRERVFQVDPPNPIEQAFYLGAVFPVALVWVIVRWRRLGPPRRLLAWLAAACAVSIWLALGRHGGLFQLFAELPLVGLLRVPSRFTLLLYFASAVVIALGFADLLDADATGRDEVRRAARWLWLVPAASGVVALAAFAIAGLAPTSALGSRIAGPRALAAGPLLFLASAALWYAAARGRRVALAGLLVLVAADPVLHAAGIWWSVPPQTLREFVDSVPAPPREPRGRVAMGYSDRMRVDAEGNVTFLASSRQIVHDTRLVWGYAGLMPTRSLPPYSRSALLVAGATHRLDRRGWHRIRDPLPRFRLLTRATTARDPWVGEIDVRTTALVEAPVTLDPGPAGSVALLEERPGAIRLSVEAPGRQLLVISESFHPGWQLAIDGEPAPVLRVYRDFMGALVAPGDRTVELDFRPRSVEVGLVLSALGLLLALAAGVRGRARRGAAPRPRPTP